MGMSEELTKKEEVGGGIFVGVTLGVLFLLLLIFWSPVAYYLEKWNDYWSDSVPASSYLSSSGERVIPVGWEYRKRANADCNKRTQSFFGLSETAISSFASSTTENYESYDCYGVEWTKIP